MPTPFEDHLTTLSPITRTWTTKETFSIALGVRSAEEQVAARLSQWCQRVIVFIGLLQLGAMDKVPWTFGWFSRLITPCRCHGQSAMYLWMVLKIIS